MDMNLGNFYSYCFRPEQLFLSPCPWFPVVRTQSSLSSVRQKTTECLCALQAVLCRETSSSESERAWPGICPFLFFPFVFAYLCLKNCSMGQKVQECITLCFSPGTSQFHFALQNIWGPSSPQMASLSPSSPFPYCYQLSCQYFNSSKLIDACPPYSTYTDKIIFSLE